LDDKAQKSGIKLDPGKKEIRISGATLGDIRRKTIVFLRLLDRKYPHIGKLLSLRGSYLTKPGDPVWKVLRTEVAQKFFASFSDNNFLGKPLLKREHETLYQDGNLNFQGKYTLRFSPYIFEPTFSDDFVYGYNGSATTEITADYINYIKLRDSWAKSKNTGVYDYLREHITIKKQQR
jgi:hypothetical protein